jgi:hypothetical protein
VPDRRLLAPAGYAVFPIVGLAIAVWSGALVPAISGAAAVIAGHVVVARTARGHRVPLTLGVLSALSLTAEWPVPALAAAASVGIPIGIGLTRLRFGDRTAAAFAAAEPAAATAYTAVFWALHPFLPSGDFALTQSARVGMAVAAAVAWHLAGAAVGTATSPERRRLSARLLIRRRIGEWQPSAALLAAGAMYAGAFPAIGWWAVVVATLPYLFAHSSLERLHGVRTTYGQTIRALGRLPEAGGFVVPGHADRTADLAVATGAELGCGPAETERIRAASLLRGIGKVALADENVVAASPGESDIALWSAAIIGEARYLSPVADIVASAPHPYRVHGKKGDDKVPRAARIVRSAAAYDDARSKGRDPLDALEDLYLGAAYDHDPQIVGALRRVLERRGVIPP